MRYKYFNTELESIFTSNVVAEINELENKLNEYESYMNEKKVIDITFTRSNAELKHLYKDISTNHGNIVIEMKHEDSITAATKNKRLSALLQMDFKVIVTEVDKENQVIRVSYKEAMRLGRQKLTRAINKELTRKDRDPSKDKIILPAKVIGIEQISNNVIVDINGYGVIGFIPGTLLRHLATRDVAKFVTIGEVLDVEILHIKQTPNMGHRYCCSRLSVIENPWIGIEHKYHKNDMVKITCVEKKSNHWFGTIDGLTDIHVFCEYPDDSNKVTNLYIEVGKTYQGAIYAVSEEKKLLKARVYTEIK